tara:strand:- start:4397 stop:5584 length:1188 start_codon:yes stop_codon:yes gene_type:complete
MVGITDKLMGLLNDPRTMDIGMGLLSAGGPSFTPHNIGQDMASAYQYANSREGERAQLEMQRMQLNQQKKQQAARAQIGQIYANTQTPQQISQGVMGQMGILGAGPGMLNPQTQAQYVRANQGLNAINNQRQQQLPGLLSEAYPEQYGAAQIKGLFAPQGSQLSSGPRDFAIMSGMQPTDPGFMKAYQQYEIDSKPIDPSRQLADQLAGQQIQANLDDQAANAELTATELRTQGTGRTRSMEEIGKIVGLMEDVEGTAVQPGIIAESVGNANQLIAAITDGFGGDATNSRRLATQYGTLNKGFDRLVNRVLPTTFTNSVFEFIKGQNMGVGQELGVNADIMISTIKQVLDDDFNSDGDYDLDRESAQAMIVRLEAMRDRALGNEPPPPPGTVRIQ